MSVRKGLSIRSTERNGWSAQNSHDRERFEPDKLNQLVQQPVAQLGEISQTLSAVYHSDVCQIEEIFKQSAIARTNWASHVILLNSKLRLGECYSSHQLINSKS